MILGAKFIFLGVLASSVITHTVLIPVLQPTPPRWPYDGYSCEYLSSHIQDDIIAIAKISARLKTLSIDDHGNFVVWDDKAEHVLKLQLTEQENDLRYLQEGFLKSGCGHS
jgi:hypothetical protein